MKTETFKKLDDEDTVVIDFPITIILADFTRIEVNSLDELGRFLQTIV
jgi:hypothetical protein